MSFTNPQLKKLVHILDLSSPSTCKAMERKIKAHLDRLPDGNQPSSSESSAQPKKQQSSSLQQFSTVSSSSSPRNSGHPITTITKPRESPTPELQLPFSPARRFIKVNLPELQIESRSENRQSQSLESPSHIESASSERNETDKVTQSSDSDVIAPAEAQRPTSSRSPTSVSTAPSAATATSRPSTSYSYLTTSTVPSSPPSSPPSPSLAEHPNNIRTAGSIHASPNSGDNAATLESGDFSLTVGKEEWRQMKRKGKQVRIGEVMPLINERTFPTSARNDENGGMEGFSSMSNVHLNTHYNYTSSKSIRYKDRHNISDRSFSSTSSLVRQSEKSGIDVDNYWTQRWYCENNLDSKEKERDVLHVNLSEFSDDEENDETDDEVLDLHELMEPKISGNEFDDLPEMTEEEFQKFKIKLERYERMRG
jgi:hypothetical protein